MDNFAALIWVAVAVVLAVMEASTAQLVSIWFVLGAVAAAITSIFVPDILIQVIVFIAVSGIALAVTRPFVKKMIKFKKVSTNSDMNIGKTAVVTIAIDNTEGKGQVKINGETWSARTTDSSKVDVGETVVVEYIEGVKLMVKPVKTPVEV